MFHKLPFFWSQINVSAVWSGTNFIRITGFYFSFEKQNELHEICSENSKYSETLQIANVSILNKSRFLKAYCKSLIL